MGNVIHWRIRKIKGVAIPPSFDFQKKKKKRKTVIELCLNNHEFFFKILEHAKVRLS